MFEIVENEQQTLVREVRFQDISEALSRPFTHTQLLGNLGSHKIRVTQQGQRNEDHTIRVVRRQLLSYGEGQASLARATGTGQRQQADRGLLQERNDGS